MRTVGQALRGYRLKSGKTQGEVASSLGKSTAFWSAIESEKKPCPTNMVAGICQIFGLDDRECSELELLADSSKTEFRLKTTNVRSDIQQVTASFARRFQELSPEDVEQIRRILEPED